MKSDTYLGSSLDKDGGGDRDIKIRTQKGEGALTETNIVRHSEVQGVEYWHLL